MFTPQQLEQITFHTSVFGGYDMDSVDEFLVETNVEEGYLKVRLIEGMQTDV